MTKSEKVIIINDIMVFCDLKTAKIPKNFTMDFFSICIWVVGHTIGEIFELGCSWSSYPWENSNGTTHVYNFQLQC